MGKDYFNSKTRILIVGKATDGWGWKEGKWDKSASLEDVYMDASNWYEELSKLPHEFIEEKIIPFYSGNRGYNSLFWNRTYRILGDLLLCQPLDDYVRKPEISEAVFRAFAWTNVFKISRRKGNPTTKLIKAQIESNTLAEEIESLQPEIVLFFTGPTYDDHLGKILSDMQLTENGTIKEVHGLEEKLATGGVALRTYHPQAPKFNMEKVVSYVKAKR